MKKDCYIVYSIVKNRETKSILEFNILNCFETESQAKASVLYEVELNAKEFGKIGIFTSEGVQFETSNENEIEILLYSNEVSFITKEEPPIVYDLKNKIGTSNGICLEAIFKNLGPNLANEKYFIERTECPNDEDYYDLKNQSGEVIHCDGEVAKVLEVNDNSILLVNEMTEKTFELSRNEFTHGWFEAKSQKQIGGEEVPIFCNTFCICDFIIVDYPCGTRESYFVSEILLDEKTNEVAAMKLTTHKEGDSPWIVTCDYYLKNRSMFKRIPNEYEKF